jgi:crotonobetainyl-CoA:carnitine CoA-transferase CaiB-like acyl-CoA transferase
MSLKPLAGTRVLDFSNLPPGAICTAMLADLGAEIVRVEPPKLKGTPSLVFGQPPMTRAKRSIALDTRNPAANPVLKRLIATVDVVVENARPGGMEAAGFGYAQARAANPRVIWCAITGFGQTGPYAHHAGHDVSFLAHSGLLGTLAEDRDALPGAQLATPFGGMAAVVGVQAALIERARTGEGGFLDISLSESAGWALTVGVDPLGERPFRVAASAERRLYRCADGRYVAVASAEPRTWSALCEGLGVPELKERLREAMGAGSAEIGALLAGRFQAKPAAQWVAELAPLGAAVTILNHGREVLDDPQVRARGSVVETGAGPVPANPVRLTAADGRRTATETAGPPTVGQDTAEVLLGAGFSQAEVDALAGAGVI